MLDTERFAAFVRAFNGVASRRTSLRAVLAAGLAAPLSRFAAEDATARKKRRKRKKKCKGGTTKCGKQCVDLATDGANCGACGNTCPLDLCFHGACVCVEDEDCPGEECQCKPTVQGVFACASETTQELCVTDDDCPLGSFCLDSSVTRVCTVACLG